MASPVNPQDKLAAPRLNPPGSSPASTLRPIRSNGGGGFLWLGLGLALLLAAALVYYFYLRPKPAADASADSGSPTAAHAGGKHHGKGDDEIRVVTATATTGDIGVYLKGLLGAVIPLNTDIIKTRVNGQLMKVLFTEGQTVKEGDLLVQIDSRPYEAQLAQYVAQKEHDQALLDNAKIDLQRYQTLVQQDSIATQTVATQASLVLQDQGTVDGDQALIDATKLNITYCNITAPISGRVGLRLVDPGNYVQSSDANGLLVINQIQPITVTFPIPEDSIQPILAKLNAGQPLPVTASTRDGKTRLATGRLLTVDNQIDPSTGTLKLKAVFPNDDLALFPNQFVSTQLLVQMKTGVTLVPVAAIQHGNNGTFVYLVDTDKSTVALTNVEVGTIDGTRAEITTGLSPGDVVVIAGVDKLQDGSKVVLPKEGARAAKSPTADAPAPAGSS